MTQKCSALFNQVLWRNCHCVISSWEQFLSFIFPLQIYPAFHCDEKREGRKGALLIQHKKRLEVCDPVFMGNGGRDDDEIFACSCFSRARRHKLLLVGRWVITHAFSSSPPSPTVPPYTLYEGRARATHRVQKVAKSARFATQIVDRKRSRGVTRNFLFLLHLFANG